MLSIIAVTMAAIAFVATRGEEPREREVSTVSQAEPSESPSATPTAEPKPEPPVRRGATFVEVYNNSGIDGLAATVGEQATDAGWNVVGTDNWVGTIPASTVYYPQRLQREGEQLALDLGIRRTYPSVSPMKGDRLTVILTDALPAG